MSLRRDGVTAHPPPDAALPGCCGGRSSVRLLWSPPDAALPGCCGLLMTQCCGVLMTQHGSSEVLSRGREVITHPITSQRRVSRSRIETLIDDTCAGFRSHPVTARGHRGHDRLLCWVCTSCAIACRLVLAAVCWSMVCWGIIRGGTARTSRCVSTLSQLQCCRAP